MLFSLKLFLSSLILGVTDERFPRYYWMARRATHCIQASSSASMSSQSACNNIAPQTPLQTHHQFTPRSPSYPPSPWRLQTHPGRETGARGYHANHCGQWNHYRPIKMISVSFENSNVQRKTNTFGKKDVDFDILRFALTLKW